MFCHVCPMCCSWSIWWLHFLRPPPPSSHSVSFWIVAICYSAVNEYLHMLCCPCHYCPSAVVKGFEPKGDGVLYNSIIIKQQSHMAAQWRARIQSKKYFCWVHGDRTYNHTKPVNGCTWTVFTVSDQLQTNLRLHLGLHLITTVPVVGWGRGTMINQGPPSVYTRAKRSHTHVKDPVVHVTVWRIMEAPK